MGSAEVSTDVDELVEGALLSKEVEEMRALLEVEEMEEVLQGNMRWRFHGHERRRE